MKKRFSVLCLLVAYAIVIGHNIIPHHHHDSTDELAEHHHESHHHDDHHSEAGLGHLLSHFIHASDAFTITVNQPVTCKIIPVVAILTETFYMERIYISPDEQEQPPDPLIVYISFDPLPSGLRAPPAAFS